MSDEKNELMLDLLIKEAVEGLSETERAELKRLEGGQGMEELGNSIEMTVAAMSLVAIDPDDKMPSHIEARIIDAGEEYMRSRRGADSVPVIATAAERSGGGMSLVNWMGWLVAAAACIALAVNLYSSRGPAENNTAQQAVIPQASPAPLTAAERRERLMATARDIKRAEMAGGKGFEGVSGDVVWSDQEQAGYMRFRGVPVNDRGKETYQLWIFDETQEEKTPIDGGTFDVDANGEVIVPIDPKLNPRNPKAFAVTVEKPGGVVVSKRERVVAIGKTSA